MIVPDFRTMNLQPVDFFSGKNREALEKYLEADGEPGKYVGFECIAPYYSHKINGITDWTGLPGGGKSYFVLEIMFYLSETYGTRHMLYTPDIGTNLEIMAKLLKMRTGKDFSNKYHNKIKLEEIYRHDGWICEHFLILQRKEIKKPITAKEFWEYVCSYTDDKRGPVDTGLIDSWKNMYKDMREFPREDLYLDYVLSYRNELSEEFKKHFHTIAHAVKTDQEEKGKKKRRVPDANDIKGGGSWYASGKNIITVDYPDKTSFGSDLHISKTKPEDVGKVGCVIEKLYLDPTRGRYFEIYEGKRYFAGELRKKLQSGEAIENINYTTSYPPLPKKDDGIAPF